MMANGVDSRRRFDADRLQRRDRASLFGGHTWRTPQIHAGGRVMESSTACSTGAVPWLDGVTEFNKSVPVRFMKAPSTHSSTSKRSVTMDERIFFSCLNLKHNHMLLSKLVLLPLLVSKTSAFDNLIDHNAGAWPNWEPVGGLTSGGFAGLPDDWYADPHETAKIVFPGDLQHSILDGLVKTARAKPDKIAYCYMQTHYPAETITIMVNTGEEVITVTNSALDNLRIKNWFPFASFARTDGGIVQVISGISSTIVVDNVMMTAKPKVISSMVDLFSRGQLLNDNCPGNIARAELRGNYSTYKSRFTWGPHL